MANSIPLEMYLDFSLRKKVDSIFINANKITTQQSDFNIFYLANTFKPNENEEIVSNKITTDDTFFLKFIDEAGLINAQMIKAAWFANIVESDYPTMKFSPTDIENYANYHKGNPVPKEGGWLYFAYCPFGTNIIEFLDGSTHKFCGDIGKIWITEKQGGLKRYVQIPKIKEVFSMQSGTKILKLAIHTKWEKYAPKKYSMVLFAPDFKIKQDEVYETLPLNDDVMFYSTADNYKVDNGLYLENLAPRGGKVPVNAKQKEDSPLQGIDHHLEITKSSYIDLTSIAKDIAKGFAFHINFTQTGFSQKETMLFEVAYGQDTHHITVGTDGNGFIVFNGKFNDERIDTKVKIEPGMFYTITYVLDNVKLLKNENNAYVSFIFLNGKQIWPKETLLNPDEKEILLKAYDVYETYRNVCMKLDYKMETLSVLDAKQICIKKLLKESGFIDIEVLSNIYQLFLNRPKPTSIDLGKIELGTGEAIINKFVVGQDAYLDILDDAYYFEGAIYDMALFKRALTRTEVDKINLFNSLGFPTFNILKGKK